MSAASWIGIRMIRGYQLFISPLLGHNCRFYPSCSQYAIEALTTHGFMKGTLLAVKRICKCAPWHPGGYDPVPPAPVLQKNGVYISEDGDR